MFFRALRDRRRNRFRNQPFPEAWRAILQRHFSLYTRLSETDRCELEGHIQVFLAEKSFEGCGGLEMSDDIRVTIAAEACLLLLHRDTDYYPKLSSILVYPHHFFASAERASGGGTVSRDERAHLGESWSTGSVILSWETIEQDSNNDHDGHNVIFHEFAHQLDLDDGAMTGAPALGEDLPFGRRRQKYAHWARVLRSEFEHLQFDARHRHRTLIDPYGAESPAEFFAVCVEAFFEKPRPLENRHPELYAELRDYFRQDPARWAPRFKMKSQP
jgi:Mlc titration factor MtfA (ptsG expression regulator)